MIQLSLLISKMFLHLLSFYGQFVITSTLASFIQNIQGGKEKTNTPTQSPKVCGKNIVTLTQVV